MVSAACLGSSSWKMRFGLPVSAFRTVRSLICLPCFVLECGVQIPALMSWFWCRGSDTHSPCSVSLCECAVSSSLGHILFCPHVLCFVLLHAVCVFIIFVQSCYFLYCAACSLCFSLAVCFHVMSLLSCLVWTRGLWVFLLAAFSCPVLHMAGNLFC